jgi:hypothetical protein
LGCRRLGPHDKRVRFPFGPDGEPPRFHDAARGPARDARPGNPPDHDHGGRRGARARPGTLGRSPRLAADEARAHQTAAVTPAGPQALYQVRARYPWQTRTPLVRSTAARGVRCFARQARRLVQDLVSRPLCSVLSGLCCEGADHRLPGTCSEALRRVIGGRPGRGRQDRPAPGAQLNGSTTDSPRAESAITAVLSQGPRLARRRWELPGQ